MMVMDKGMSLIELMIILSIITITAFIAIPAFSGLLENYKFKSVVLQLEKDLRFAKYTANQKKTRVSICSVNHLQQCNKTLSNNWHQGWLVFLDPNNNFEPLPHNILRHRTSIARSITIKSSYNIQHGIQFNTGKKAGRGLGTGLANGYFIICGANKNAHKFVLGIYGRLRTESSFNEC